MVTLISFSRSHLHFETQILIEKSLSAHYLFNQWLELYQISTDTSLGQGKEVIRFWWPWPHFQGHCIIKTLKMSLVCTLSYESNRWNLTKLAQIHHWDGGMKWLIWVTLISFSRSHWHFETQILIEKSLSAHYLLNQWLEFDQTSTDTCTSFGWGKSD